MQRKKVKISEPPPEVDELLNESEPKNVEEEKFETPSHEKRHTDSAYGIGLLLGSFAAIVIGTTFIFFTVINEK